jgi:hypothetical protein
MSVRMNADKDLRSESHGSIEICHGPQTLQSIQRSQAPRVLEMFGNSGRATSVNINESCKSVAMTWLSSSSNSGIAVTSMASGNIDDRSIVLGPG